MASNPNENIHKFVGQRLYKCSSQQHHSLHAKLSKRAQELTGMPLINYNLQPPVQKEPLKRTFSACTSTEGPMCWQPHWSHHQPPSSATNASSNFQPLESMPEILGKPLLGETLSMPLLQNYLSIDSNATTSTIKSAAQSEDEVEIGSGDEERLLPMDLLLDDDELESGHRHAKPALRKTWSWTPADEELLNKKKPESTMRQLERAIKSLSIDPNVSISRKF